LSISSQPPFNRVNEYRDINAPTPYSVSVDIHERHGFSISNLEVLCRASQSIIDRAGPSLTRLSLSLPMSFLVVPVTLARPTNIKTVNGMSFVLPIPVDCHAVDLRDDPDAPPPNRLLTPAHYIRRALQHGSGRQILSFADPTEELPHELMKDSLLYPVLRANRRMRAGWALISLLIVANGRSDWKAAVVDEKKQAGFEYKRYGASAKQIEPFIPTIMELACIIEPVTTHVRNDGDTSMQGKADGVDHTEFSKPLEMTELELSFTIARIRRLRYFHAAIGTTYQSRKRRHATSEHLTSDVEPIARLNYAFAATSKK